MANDDTITFRISAELKETLIQKAKEKKLTLSQYILSLVSDKREIAERFDILSLQVNEVKEQLEAMSKERG